MFGFHWKSCAMSDVEDYYSVLGCKENASFEEIKKCYHEKALAYHPDKGGCDMRSVTDFDKISKAWRTLSDPLERQVYNAMLSQQRLSQQSLVFGTFCLRELMFDSNKNVYTYECRCGGQFAIDAGDLAHCDGCDVSVECDSCSLVIYINLS